MFFKCFNFIYLRKDDLHLHSYSLFHNTAGLQIRLGFTQIRPLRKKTGSGSNLREKAGSDLHEKTGSDHLKKPESGSYLINLPLTFLA